MMQFKTTTLLLFTALALACFALSPQAQAVCNDACLPNFNTVQGTNALNSLTTGLENTAVGVDALKFDSTGSENTAIGVEALSSNIDAGFNTDHVASRIVNANHGNM